MESSHDPIDATDKVPSSWDEVEARPTPASPTPRPIPSIVRRDAVAPLAKAVIDRIERASTQTPAPPPVAKRAKPAASIAPAASMTRVPSFAIASEHVASAKDDITSRRTIPLAPRKIDGAPAVAKIEIARVPAPAKSESAPPPALAKIEIVRVPAPANVGLASPPAPVAAEIAFAPPVTPTAVQPAPVETPAAISPSDVHRGDRDVAPAFGAGNYSGDPDDAFDHQVTIVDPRSQPRTFGAGMLAANEIDAKRPAPDPHESDRAAAFDADLQAREVDAKPPTVAATAAPDPVPAPTFGAGMLRGRKGRTKRDDMPARAPVVATATPDLGVTASTFGAGMLAAHKVAAKRAVPSEPEPQVMPAQAPPVVAAASSDPGIAASTFGAGMLAAHKVTPKRAAPLDPKPPDSDRDVAAAVPKRDVMAAQAPTVEAIASSEPIPPGSTFGAGMLAPNEVDAKRAVPSEPEPLTMPAQAPSVVAAASSDSGTAASTFGAGMLAAHKVSPKRAARLDPKPHGDDRDVAPALAKRDVMPARSPTGEAAASTDPVVGAPTFGAGMLRGRKGRTKRDEVPAQAPAVATAAPDAGATGSTFGAGMLAAHKVDAKRSVPSEREPQTMPTQAQSVEAPASSEPIARAPTFGAGMLRGRKGRTRRDEMPAQALAAAKRDVMPAHAPVVATAAQAPGAAASTFGAGMLRSKGRTMRDERPKTPAVVMRDEMPARAPIVEVTASSEPVVAAPTFGAGMLRSKGRAKRDELQLPAQAPAAVATAAPDPAAAASTFGAGVLRARSSRGRWVVAIVLAVAAIAAGYLLTRGDASSGKPAAPALQNK